MTFGAHKLPEFITAGYLRLAVSQFFPNPLRCYKCQRFGHHKDKCRSDIACQICSEVGHDTRECQKPPKCRNCEGSHSPNAKECPAWKKEKEIVKVKTENNISFPEARRRCESRNVAGPVTYAQAAAATSATSKSTASTTSTSSKTTTNTIATQTNITWPNKSENYTIMTTETQTQTIESSPSADTQTIESSSSANTPTVTNKSKTPTAKTPPLPNKSKTTVANTKPTNKPKPGPASYKKQHQKNTQPTQPKNNEQTNNEQIEVVEVEVHNRFYGLSEEEQEDMDTNTSHKPSDGSSPPDKGN